jgi:hypothetical protein
MQQISKSTEVLANWNYEPDLWRDFLEYESTVYKGSVKAARHLFFGVLILTVVVVFLIVSITLWVTDRWSLAMLSPAVAVAVIGWIFIVITGIFWLYRRDRMNRLKARTGRVIITPNRVQINGVNFSWDYEASGVRFRKIERKTVSVNSGKSFEILEFFTLNDIPSYKGRTQEYFECRVPIPFGKEAEAEAVMNNLRTRLLSAENEWIKKNFALGHDFSMSICRKCGETVAEAASFSKHKCRG